MHSPARTPSARVSPRRPIVPTAVSVLALAFSRGLVDLPGLPTHSIPGLAAQESGDDDAAEDEEGLPLPVDRTLPVDLDEGSWISLDVSPDGETIVFDYLGDLFTIPITGGTATRITSGLAFDAQPRFSPDGSRIAFTSDRDGGQNIWIMALDGSDTVQVSEGAANRAESPEWMPDGDYVVAAMGNFRLGGLPRLKLFHVKGGSGVELLSEPDDLKTLGPAPSPDGRYIWYARRTGDWSYNAQLPQYQLETYDLESGETHEASARHGSGMRPTLSPDGRWLVYATRHDDGTGLVLRDLETGEERWLAYPVQRDDQESRATLDLLPGMSFTPDSRHLVASYGGKIWKIPVTPEDEGDAGAESGAEEISFRVRFDLELGPRLEFDYPIEDTPNFVVRQIRDPAPSPDGERLAFTALDRLWVSGIDGTDAERLTDAEVSEHFATWSPDGEWIAYSTWDGEEGRLYKVRSDGSGSPILLTGNPAVYFSPAWGPDDRIVAVRGFRRAYLTQGEEGAPLTELVRVSADPDGDDGGPVTVIEPTDGRADPHFVDGSDRIHLFRQPDLLVSIRWDGTDEQEHVKVRGPTPAGTDEALTPSTIRMAPSGERALVLLQRQIYTVTVPRIGTTPTVSVADPESASLPVRQLTEIGGEFPTWGGDGRTVHWSLGNAHFVYDLDAAEAHADSVAAADAADADGPPQDDGEPDPVDDDEEEDEDDGYEAAENRVLIEAERDIPRGVTALRGARVVTMNGSEVIENADIVIRDNRIESVGSRGSVTIPDEATVIDVSGRTIVPGFVDTHAHLRARDRLHRTDVWPYLANLAYGVTTTRDPQTGNTEVLSYADMVRTGAVLGPRIYSTGPGIFFQDGIDTEEEARDALERYADYYDTKTIKMYVSAARKGRQHILMAARDLGLMPTTEGALNLNQNLTEILGAEAIGLDGDVGSIEPGKLADLVILRENPLDELRNTNTVDRVMLDGHLYDGDTLTEVHPRERPIEPLWWWDDEPEDVPGL